MLLGDGWGAFGELPVCGGLCRDGLRDHHPQDPETLRYGFDGFGRVGQTSDSGPIPCVRRLSEEDQANLAAKIKSLGLDAPSESVVLTTPCPSGMVQVDLADEGRRWSHRLSLEEAAELVQFCEQCTGEDGVADLPNARYSWGRPLGSLARGGFRLT